MAHSAEGSAAEAVDLRGRVWTSPRQNRQASVIPTANPLASPPTISTVDGGRTGPPATNRCQPRQAWKGAAVAADSGAGVRLVGPPPSTHRRGVRAAEGARLESVYGLIAHRGFESLPLRHVMYATYCCYCRTHYFECVDITTDIINATGGLARSVCSEEDYSRVGSGVIRWPGLSL